ncbi:ABC transporter substrate-binding protein [Reyranella sp. CPCC 100927]|uniref:ABC transporter substrate-binding protein n=1 Tax=Reyranella sp. CPCC 100927 TaxID=2599616 RepID=UPI0011B5DB35|nr:ABC transporter substrate-binding protein [Reyranella sp. CPCC 100927]TWT10586.1 ABC transporter substrate-binding protein [Reyranella sp. CPCC 100927]
MLTKRAFMTSTVAVAATAIAGSARAQAEEITYLLPAAAFLPAFGPWMLAQGRGYYAAEGLKVNFVVAKGGVDVAKQVGVGNALIGGAIGDTPIIARAQGIPVKAVAVLGGRSLTQLVVHDGKGINGPKDLKGRIITTMAYQDTTFFALQGMLASAGLSKNDVDAQAAGPAGVWQLFAAGKADAMAAVPDWIASVTDAGIKIKIFSSDDFFKSMAQAILVADDTIQKRPDVVRKLVRATLKGMQDIMKDPAAAARDYISAVPQHKGKEAYIEAVFRLYNTYVYPGQTVLGTIDAERLAAVQQFYVKEGIVPKAVPVADLFTNQFVQ